MFERQATRDLLGVFLKQLFQSKENPCPLDSWSLAPSRERSAGGGNRGVYVSSGRQRDATEGFPGSGVFNAE